MSIISSKVSLWNSTNLIAASALRGFTTNILSLSYLLSSFATRAKILEMAENYRSCLEQDGNLTYSPKSSRILFRAPIEPYLASNRVSLAVPQLNSFVSRTSLLANSGSFPKSFLHGYSSDRVRSFIAMPPTAVKNAPRASGLHESSFSEPNCRTILDNRTACLHPHHSQDEERNGHGQTFELENARALLQASPTTICLKRPFSPPKITLSESTANHPHAEPRSFWSPQTFLLPPVATDLEGATIPHTKSVEERLQANISNSFRRHCTKTCPEVRQSLADDTMVLQSSLESSMRLPCLPTIRRIRRSRRLLVCKIQQRKSRWDSVIANTPS